METVDLIVSADEAMHAAFEARVPEGARVAIALPAPSSAGATVSPALVPYPDLTVRLAELGFVIDDVTTHGSTSHLHARKTSIVVRRYRDGDEDAIRTLFHRSFHHALSPAAWRWRYRDHPHGGLRITVACAADGTLLGHYGGYPMAFHSVGFSGAGHSLRAHQNGDVMTDPRARRLGRGTASIVRRMAQHFWAAYGEGRVDFHYGFNTGTARELQKRVVPGVRVLEEVGTWVCDAPLLAQSRDTRLHAERVTRFDAEWDAFARRAPEYGYGLLSARDAAFMNWRYIDRPGSDDVAIVVRAHGRIAGAAVFQRHADETRWGDALFDPRALTGDTAAPAAVSTTLTGDAAAASAAATAASAALAAGLATDAAPRVRAWFPARPEWWAQTLTRLGFRQEPEPHGLSLVYVPFTPIVEPLLPTLYYSWGDSDLF